MIKRALISVSDKRGIVEFAKQLVDLGIEILSTGGTAALLLENGIKAIEVSDCTGFPEIMDGRVKTLHPLIHGGILARRGIDDAVMKEHGINTIDMIVVNLYPFEETICDPSSTLEQAIENIDIGGPTMLRAAAKNYRHVTVVVDDADYSSINTAIHNNGEIDASLRFHLAVKAFEHTARYDAAIANYLGKTLSHQEGGRFPRTLNLQYSLKQNMRYGENPHQQAAFYVDGSSSASVSTSIQLQGKSLSYNNIADTDAALECIKQFNTHPTCVIVKHANPCGVATGENLNEAYERAYSTDPESAFGGILAFNRELDQQTAENIIDKQFVEVIIAPDITQQAIESLARKKNIRVLKCGAWSTAQTGLDFKKVNGGLLVQDIDNELNNKLEIVTEKSPNSRQMNDLIFTWKVAKFVKSNAIVYARDEMTVGVGAGQMSRVNSARIAAIKASHANLQVEGAVMASDAFFPFRDGIDKAAEVGIAAIIQPGGSMRDEEVIAAANEHGISMVFTAMRHFRH